ncbi:MAG: sulfite exporter TauE/SafE family protein [Pseudomonadales bacterium]|nr:sulfite exporter TauE/SafE family protein [Pseudomonadales bacterium]
MEDWNVTKSAPKTYIWIWFLWVGVFYTIWILLVVGQAKWGSVADHWPISLAMAMGSYAAGATPMGGGTIGFPVLVMWYEMPSSLGRDFSFVIQAIGMTSASILIFVRRQPVAKHVLIGAILGSLVGTPVGIIYVAPYLDGLWVKLIFSIVWASFGALHLFRVKEISRNIGHGGYEKKIDLKIGFILSLFATILLTSVTGVGVDMILYCALVLLFRTDLKIAIPTSVVIMAFTSIIAVFTKCITGGFYPGVYENWLAAAPVVILGAPIGVIIVGYVGRKFTLYFVAILCVFQYVWVCVEEYQELKIIGIFLTFLAIALTMILLEFLRSMGNKLGSSKRIEGTRKLRYV